EYSEKNGIVLDGLIRQGFMEYDYYQIQDGAVSLIHHFSCSYDEKTLLYGTGEWICSDCKIDDVPVSESVYNAAFSEITDNFTFKSAGWSTGQYVCRVMGDGC
ncbi:MAG: hypothetical protein LUC94_05515, partial [Clostridiales bacterium]|nr:hypothetical protein [Clostridiales bacterium]